MRIFFVAMNGHAAIINAQIVAQRLDYFAIQSQVIKMYGDILKSYEQTS